MHDLAHQSFEIIKQVGYFILFTVFVKYVIAKWIADVLRKLLLRLLINSRDDWSLYWEYRHKAGKHKPSE